MSLATDFRLASRALVRSPGWTLAVAGTLAIGLGGATVVGGIAYGILVRPLPYPESGRLVRLYEVDARGRRMDFADPNYEDLAALPGTFEAISKAPTWKVQAMIATEPLQLRRAEVTEQFFDVLHVEPIRGRRFSADERIEGAEPVAMVSESFWRARLGAPAELDRVELRIAGVRTRVVGVLPPGFDFPSGAEIWVPREPRGTLTSRTAHNEPIYARLADGVSIEQARSRARELGGRLARDHAGRIDLVGIAVEPLLDSLVVGARPTVLLELAAAAFLLAAAVVNSASLLLARLESRRRDLATRLALGAGGREIGSLLFAETLLLAVLGAGGGAALAAASIEAVRRISPTVLPRLEAVRFDGLVAAGSAGVALLIALSLALLAARRALGWNVERELRESAGSIAGGHRWLRGLPVAVQAGAAIVLLAGAALFASSLWRLTAVDPGFDPQGVRVLDFAPAPADDPAAVERRAVTLDELESELATLPGVRAAGLISSLPIAASAANGTFFELAGPSLPEPPDFETMLQASSTSGNALFLVASASYFRAMRIPLLSGRLFEPGDVRDRQHVALVSKSLAEATWPGRSALGRYLEFGNMDGDLRPLLVVGVVDDVHQRGLARGPQPAIYVAARQRPASAWSWSAVVAGAAVSPETLTRAARRSFPEAPTATHDLEAMISGSVADRELLLAVLSAFAIATIALAATGIYGSVSFAVARRRREYAVRLALGAESGTVAGRAFAGGLSPVAAGAVAGLAVALAGGRLLESMLYGIRPQHLPSLTAAVLVVALFSTLSAWLPARRIARIEPATVLRAE